MRFIDPDGKTFPSIRAMCKYHNVSFNEFRYRYNVLKLPLNEALKTSKIVDKFGNSFKSITAFCNFYYISTSTFYKCRLNNMTIDEIVDKYISKRDNNIKSPRLYKVMEYDGHTFPSVETMCKYYNIKPNTFYVRKRRGFTLEECIHGKEKKVKSKIVKPIKNIVDHLGNSFSTVEEMCRYWGVKRGTYESRLERGFDIKDCLNPKKFKGHPCFYMGKAYSTEKEMCEKFGVNYNNFIVYKLSHHLTYKEAMDIFVKRKLETT